MPVATATFKDSAPPLRGILIFFAARDCSTGLIPFDSFPISRSASVTRIFSCRSSPSKELAKTVFPGFSLMYSARSRINYFNPYYASHGGLYDFLVENIHRFMTTYNLFYSEPICRSNDRTEISRILYGVKQKNQPFVFVF